MPQGRANPIIGTAVATGAANALGSQAPRLDCQLPVASVQKLGARNITGTNIVESTEVRTIFWASVIASRPLLDVAILPLNQLGRKDSHLEISAPKTPGRPIRTTGPQIPRKFQKPFSPN